MEKLLHGCSLELLKTLDGNSVDSVVTDPPYGLAFMGKKWDYDVPSVELWREVFRVLKPGGHVLSFGGTRTYHRMVVSIEDAGFEIRDQIQWIYGSGFPKSHNIKEGTHAGFGTALKPAFEPIVLARKPLIGTVAENVTAFGTGGLNIDASRIGVSENDPNKRKSTGGYASSDSLATVPNAPYNKTRDATLTEGRWPANVLFDEEAAAVLDAQSGTSRSTDRVRVNKNPTGNGNTHGHMKPVNSFGFADSGGASRFFYVAKASKRERGEGNSHPTVKPIKLMEYLVRLVTPPCGTVLDPFMGSGTTGVACKNLGFQFVGIEREQAYLEIAKRRIEFHMGVL